MKDYLKLLRFVKPYKGMFALASLFMVLSAIFDGVSLGMIIPFADKIFTNKKIIIPAKMPAFVNYLVDKINNTPQGVLLNYMILGIISLFIVKGIVGYFQAYLMSNIGQHVVKDIRNKLYAKLQTLSLDYFTQKRGGEMISRITNDVKLVENAVSYGSTDLVYQTAQVIIFLFITFFLNFKLAVVTFLLVPLIALPMIKVGKVLRKLSKRSQEKMADINSLLYETIIGTRIVKAFNMEDYEVGKFNNVNYDYYKISIKSIKRLLMLSPITEIVGVLAASIILFWGSKDIISGKISFGVFGVSLGALLSVIRPFKKLSQVNSINQQAVAASERIYEVLETDPTVVDKVAAGKLGDFKDKVVFEGVWFNYGHHEILKNINLEVKKGQMLAIVGPSGSGKSTLVDLIPRFYDPKKGRILIDGMDIREVSLNSLRQQIGIVTQETILFNDTIKANIAYGSNIASQEDIERAAVQAHAHDFIQHLSQGYDTFIGDRGMKLSGGERQRIAIARALMKNPPILILDEATSQLDTQAERIVQEALDSLIKGRTVFVIAHRLSTVRSAHKIMVLEHGAIVQQGTHGELLDKGGLYKILCSMQEMQK
ncbi:MAG: ABC transporter ATP-binding protein/permease [Candidatus Omnitrophica bacterium]|nr:ABC transporter ATP-binding protein/permease [Candidatus Omnitrophota bacterium]MBU1868938.1 ABC transporter ATP-binding protein/permease [Candidatus Omnitrophota bacterium]